MPLLAMSEQALTIEVTPLSPQERVRLGQLELVIERGLSQFLAVGKALMEVRNSRLYRDRYPTFEAYCRERFALARSTADQIVRSASTAQLLIDNGVELPANTSEAVVRPVSALRSPELQTATWKLIEAASPQCGPTQPISSKIARVIKNAIESNGSNDNGHKPRSKSHPSRERPFVQSAQRLSAYKGFDAGIVTAHVEKLPSAWSVFNACNKLIERCEEVKHRLIDRFPELANA
jgi:hypothetical protein